MAADTRRAACRGYRADEDVHEATNGSVTSETGRSSLREVVFPSTAARPRKIAAWRGSLDGSRDVAADSATANTARQCYPLLPVADVGSTSLTVLMKAKIGQHRRDVPIAVAAASQHQEEVEIHGILPVFIQPISFFEDSAPKNVAVDGMYNTR